MLAVIEKTADGYMARMERKWNDAPEEVWSWLTNNEKLRQWFSELSVESLQEGGLIKFDMGNGTFEEMKITRLVIGSVLEYTWGDDRVRFELEPMPGGCLLQFMEEITAVTSHTPRDIAGWDVCLDVVGLLLSGKAAENLNRKEMWQAKYDQYVRRFEELAMA